MVNQTNTRIFYPLKSNKIECTIALTDIEKIYYRTHPCNSLNSPTTLALSEAKKTTNDNE